MEFDIDQSQILYAVGAFLSVASAGYLIGSQVSLSPLTKSVLLLLSFAGFYLVGQNIEGKEIRIITLGLSGISAVLFVMYTVFRFDIPSSLTLLGLAVSAVLFMVAGYNLDRIRAYQWPFSSRQAVIGAVFLGLILTGADMATSDLQYNYQWEESVNISDEEDTRIGEVTVSNSFLLPREIERPEYDVCIYTPERRSVYTSVEGDEGLLWHGKKEMEITGRTVDRAEHEPVNGTFSVEKISGDCPMEASERKIMVTEKQSATPYT